MTEGKEELQERGNVCVYMCVREINSQRQIETVKKSQRQRVIPSPQGSYH